jgi:hypothetical protein
VKTCFFKPRARTNWRRTGGTIIRLFRAAAMAAATVNYVENTYLRCRSAIFPDEDRRSRFLTSSWSDEEASPEIVSLVFRKPKNSMTPKNQCISQRDSFVLTEINYETCVLPRAKCSLTFIVSPNKFHPKLRVGLGQPLARQRPLDSIDASELKAQHSNV